MKSRIMYPYFYGDEGKGLDLSNKQISLFIPSLLVLLSIGSIPLAANAENCTEILLRIEEAIKGLDDSTRAPRGISPISAASCVISGICLGQARIALTKGNNPLAASLICGAAFALCADRVAQAQGL